MRRLLRSEQWPRSSNDETVRLVTQGLQFRARSNLERAIGIDVIFFHRPTSSLEGN